VIYVVSLADYDLMMEEDPTMNRLLESFDLFNKGENKEKDNILFVIRFVLQL
jgi:hypothetical protein